MWLWLTENAPRPPWLDGLNTSSRSSVYSLFACLVLEHHADAYKRAGAPSLLWPATAVALALALGRSVVLTGEANLDIQTYLLYRN